MDCIKKWPNLEKEPPDPTSPISGAHSNERNANNFNSRRTDKQIITLKHFFKIKSNNNFIFFEYFNF